AIDGGLGANTLQGNNVANNWIITGPNKGTVPGVTGGFSHIGSLIGGTQTDTFHLQGGTLTGSVTGGGGNDTFFADNVANTWTITDQNTGQVTGIVGTFNGIANLVGGTANDTFRLSTGTTTGSITGSIDG